MLYKKQCPFCEKVIESLSKDQFDYNYQEHVKSHERKNKKKNNGKKKDKF